MTVCQRLLGLVLLSGGMLLTGPWSIAAAADGREAPDPEDITLYTKDGVELRGTFYPSAGGDKSEIVPIVMLHDHKETRAVFSGVARALQQLGAAEDGIRAPRAVVTIDFRGHGDSTAARTRGGGSVELDASKFRPDDYEAMVLFDMEAVRKFLVGKNNAGELNLNQLCVVGCGMGANIAVLWAANDWSVPPLPRIKQGEDVKALVLLSPRWNYRGLPLVQALKHPAIQRDLSIYLAYGEDDKQQAKDAKNIYKNLERFHPEPPRDQIAERKSLYYVGLPTSLKGTELLTERQFRVGPRIDEFIELRLGQKEFRWVDRSGK